MTSRQLEDERHCRLPFYVVGTECDAEDLIKKPDEGDLVSAENRKFCAFIVSNTSKKASERVLFFQRLQKEYKKVDSGGRAFNNMGCRVPPGGQAKHDFIRKYKFNLCFENKSIPGYITEKLVEAMWARCIPIYWGCPSVGKEFNTKSFICRHDFETEEAFIRRIKEIDQDDEAYRAMLSEPFFHKNTPNAYFDLERYERFLRKAVETDIKPVCQRRKFWHFVAGRWRLGKRMR